MAYKLSLVTTDIRKRMVEAVDKEKVHDNEKTYISTKEYKDRQQDEYNSNTSKSKKRYLTVNAVKEGNKRVKVEAEMDKSILDDSSLGIFIDKKK